MCRIEKTDLLFYDENEIGWNDAGPLVSLFFECQFRAGLPASLDVDRQDFLHLHFATGGVLKRLCNFQLLCRSLVEIFQGDRESPLDGRRLCV